MRGSQLGVIVSPELSVAVMVYVTAAVSEFAGRVAVVPVGAENVGGVISVTVTVNVVVASLPLESAAVHVTSVGPSSN